MPINFVTGLPRQGKTLSTIVFVKARAEKENRPVYYCNIPEVTVPGWIEIDHPDKWLELPNDAIIIVDELQDFWGQAPAGAKVPEPILELSKHGKRGIDFYFITQDPSLVHSTPKKLCEWHYDVVRHFGGNSCTLYKHKRMQSQPEKLKKKAQEQIFFKYPKEVFGKKDKAGNWIQKPWYKSADVHNIKRQIPWKVYALPIMAIVAAASIYGSWHMLNRSVDKAKETAGGGNPLSSFVPGTNGGNVAVPPSARAGQQQVRMTKEEWIAQHKPRLGDFPNTAPKYDEVTRPVHAPYPAACVTMKDKCECYTQQGTKLPGTSRDVCLQIVQNGYFVDWQLPEPKAPAPMATNKAPEPAKRLVSAPAPGTGSVQTEDAEFEQWKQEQAKLDALNALAVRNAAIRASWQEEQAKQEALNNLALRAGQRGMMRGGENHASY